MSAITEATPAPTISQAVRDAIKDVSPRLELAAIPFHTGYRVSLIEHWDKRDTRQADNRFDLLGSQSEAKVDANIATSVREAFDFVERCLVAQRELMDDAKRQSLIERIKTYDARKAKQEPGK